MFIVTDLVTLTVLSANQFDVRIVFIVTDLVTLTVLSANQFDVRIVLHGQVTLAAVNNIYVFHEAMNGCKNLKIH